MDCRVGFQGNPSRNDKAMYGRMTDIAQKKRRSGTGLDQRGGSPKGPCQARGAPAYLSSLDYRFTRLVIARAEPVAIHCEPVSEQTNRIVSLEIRWIAASSILSSSQLQNSVVTEPHTPFLSTLSSRGRMPVAIHCEH